MKTAALLCSFILLTGISCNNKKEAHITPLHEFKNTLHLKGQSNHVESDKYKSPLLAVIDSFLIVYDPRLYNSLLSIHNKYTFRKIADYGFVGRGPGEVAMKGFWHVDADGKNIFIQDAVKKKIFRFSLDSMLSQGNDYFPENDYYVLPDGGKEFIGKFIVDDEAIITADNWGAGLLSFFNRDGNLIEEIGRHFLENDGYPIRGYKQLLNVFLIKHPDQQKYAISYVNYDRLSILDAKGAVLNTFVGPDFIEPEVAFDSRHKINKVSDVRGYMFLHGNGDYIFAQYFGKQYYEREGNGSLIRNSSNTIHVFDWHGKVVARIKLDRGIEDFTVDGESLIAFDPSSEDPFVRYDISDLLEYNR